jgi:4-carboxymuconolactone decarboxylase
MATDYSEFNARKRSGNGASPAGRENGSAGSSQAPNYRNAVLDDYDLQAGLSAVNSKFGDFCTRVAGEAWGQPLIDQKTKALITIAVDVVNQERVSGPMAVHVDMARKQGATRAEVEELLLFMCVYAGFNKAAACFSVLDEVFGPAR